MEIFRYLKLNEEDRWSQERNVLILAGIILSEYDQYLEI
jgi:hypothetical protein